MGAWRYYSVNEVWVDGRRVAKDVILLDQEKGGGREGFQMGWCAPRQEAG